MFIQPILFGTPKQPPTAPPYNYMLWVSDNPGVTTPQNKRILTSADGINWTVHAWTGPTVVGAGLIRKIKWFGNYYIAVGGQGQILRSVDGLTWIEVPLASTVAKNGIYYRDVIEFLDLIYAVGTNEGVTPDAYSSKASSSTIGGDLAGPYTSLLYRNTMWTGQKNASDQQNIVTNNFVTTRGLDSGSITRVTTATVHTGVNPGLYAAGGYEAPPDPSDPPRPNSIWQWLGDGSSSQGGFITTGLQKAGWGKTFQFPVNGSDNLATITTMTSSPTTMAVYLSNGKVWSSTNGRTWFSATLPNPPLTPPDPFVPTPPEVSRWPQLIWSGTQFMLIANRRSYYWTSPDALTWTLRTLPDINYWPVGIYSPQ